MYRKYVRIIIYAAGADRKWKNLQDVMYLEKVIPLSLQRKTEHCP